MEILRTDKLTKHFGGVKAVQQVDMSLSEGDVLGLIGPNGAGKSTFFGTMAGYLKPDSGKVIFRGQDITGWQPHRVAKLGMARTFQIVRPINDMNVLENVTVGAFMHTTSTFKAMEEARKVLAFVGLEYKAEFEMRELTLADKKRLEVARALASQPKVLLFDEVMAGLNSTETHDAVQLIRKINKELGITIIIVEHVMEVILPLSSRLIVLDYGAKIAEGLPNDVMQDPSVIKAYLGDHKVGEE